jgi:hypothetical protein
MNSGVPAECKTNVPHDRSLSGKSESKHEQMIKSLTLSNNTNN